MYQGKATLCNACGIKWRVKKQQQGMSEVHPSPSGPKPASPTQQTSVSRSPVLLSVSSSPAVRPREPIWIDSSAHVLQAVNKRKRSGTPPPDTSPLPQSQPQPSPQSPEKRDSPQPMDEDVLFYNHMVITS